MPMAWLQYAKLFISFVAFVYFQDKYLSLIISLSLNNLKMATRKSLHWHLGIGIQI